MTLRHYASPASPVDACLSRVPQLRASLALHVSSEEVKILSEIRTSGADKVNIRLKDGKITLIEKVFEGKKDDFKSLHELIGGINHGEATLKIENGKVTYIQALDKEKLEGKK